MQSINFHQLYEALMHPESWINREEQYLLHDNGCKIFLHKNLYNINMYDMSLLPYYPPAPNSNWPVFLKCNSYILGSLYLEDPFDLIGIKSALSHQIGPKAWHLLDAISDKIAEKFAINEGLWKREEQEEVIFLEKDGIYCLSIEDMLWPFFKDHNILKLEGYKFYHPKTLIIKPAQSQHLALQYKCILQEYKNELPLWMM